MIIDSHCHAWDLWPYQPPVPDPDRRGRIEQLLWEMDQNGVERAVIICAGIDHNPDNNAYVAEAAARHPGRFLPFADIDSRWSPSHQAPGGAGRLREAVARWGIRGFTHYLRETDDGSWLDGADGRALFAAAAELGLIASLAVVPAHMPAIRRLAAAFPTLPILLHHLGRPSHEPGRSGILAVAAAAAEPSIHVKVSGFGYAAAPGAAHPYAEVHWLLRVLHEAFGAGRLCWGSDYPVVRKFMTYRQSLGCVQDAAAHMPAEDRALLFGGTLARLLALSRLPA